MMRQRVPTPGVVDSSKASVRNAVCIVGLLRLRWVGDDEDLLITSLLPGAAFARWFGTCVNNLLI